MSCDYCDIVESDKVLFKNNILAIAIKDHAATPGHITVFPIKHFTIMEMVPNDILGACATAANNVSVAVFESLGAQGTNIIMRNGLGAGQSVPHFSIDIIPRQENDGINFEWEPKQLMEDDLELIFSKLQNAEVSLEEPKSEEASEKKDLKDSKKDNYLLKSLKRIP
jgi:diadenosine tetraphosphate (Ap4A) HIT family hydrolase